MRTDVLLAELRAAIDGDRDETHRTAHSTTLDVLDRTAHADVWDRRGWSHLPIAAATVVGQERWPMTVAVMANTLAMTDLGETADLAALSSLVEQYGHRAVAASQLAVDERLATGPGRPLADGLGRTLLDGDVAERLVQGGVDPERARDVARACAGAGFWLTMPEVEPDDRGPRLATVEDAVACVDDGSVAGWRGQIANIADNPWGPYPHELLQLLTAGERPGHAAAMEGVISFYRDSAERRDRDLVAREIRRLVAVSGLSQRQFAANCGTSASRLCTYVNGLVTPSASMMLRIRRISKLAQEQALRQGQDAS